MKKILIISSLSLLFTNAFAAGECKEGETAYTNKCVNHNCTFCYNSKTEDLRIVPNSDVQKGDAVIIEGRAWGHANNVTIEEGITGSQTWVFGYGEGSCSTCTLKLPSTFDTVINTETPYAPFWNNQFGTVDLSAVKNLNIDFELPTSKSQIIILDPNSNIKINSNSTYSTPNSAVKITIQCKGADLKACQDMVRTSKNLSTVYYQGTDEKGRIQQWSKDGLFIYQYAPNGDYTLFDENENILGHFMADGSKRRIYTVDEATAVTGRKNTFSICYR